MDTFLKLGFPCYCLPLRAMINDYRAFLAHQGNISPPIAQALKELRGGPLTFELPNIELRQRAEYNPANGGASYTAGITTNWRQHQLCQAQLQFV